MQQFVFWDLLLIAPSQAQINWNFCSESVQYKQKQSNTLLSKVNYDFIKLIAINLN